MSEIMSEIMSEKKIMSDNINEKNLRVDEKPDEAKKKSEIKFQFFQTIYIALSVTLFFFRSFLLPLPLYPSPYTFLISLIFLHLSLSLSVSLSLSLPLSLFLSLSLSLLLKILHLSLSLSLSLYLSSSLSFKDIYILYIQKYIMFIDFGSYYKLYNQIVASK